MSRISGNVRIYGERFIGSGNVRIRRNQAEMDVLKLEWILFYLVKESTIVDLIQYYFLIHVMNYDL